MGRGARAVNALCFFVGCVFALGFVDVRTTRPAERRRGDVRFACLVLTAPGNADRRDAIRRTWLKLAVGDGFRHYFAIGTAELGDDVVRALFEEREAHGDLLLVPFVDDYSTLATKLLLSLKALNDELAANSYVIKVDDDSFVRLDRIIAELKSRRSRDRRQLYWGYFKGNARVRRDGKWGESEWSLCDRYLPYALGGGYVLSSGIVEFVAKNADSLRAYRSEDVTVGVWTAPLADVERRHDVRFDTEWTSRGCENSFLIRHKQSTESMVEMYDNLVRSSGVDLCSDVRSLRPSYEYDWSVPPSLCCIAKKPGQN